MPSALALSPHLDDAAFSCGGTLATLAAGGWRVVVATLFALSVPDPSGFALACQLDKGLGPEVDYMALRRAEDGAAMRALRAEAIHVALPEAPHRGYESAAALFGEVGAEDRIADLLDAAIADLLGEVRPDLVLAPQAIGGHVDHVQVARALHRAAPTAPGLRWRDFPYTVRQAAPRDPFASRHAALPHVGVTLAPEAVAAKREACLAYRSQLGFQFGGPAGLLRRLGEDGPVERFRGAAGPAAALLGTLP